ncbi:hypothetical protein [Marinactinospora rubrisoli]|uniref:Secreted protein n=1 Tax=Marinactinospora rubrisoli TaxID=2715399 RepID=A0ABW2KJH8_9ACTN
MPTVPRQPRRSSAPARAALCVLPTVLLVLLVAGGSAEPARAAPGRTGGPPSGAVGVGVECDGGAVRGRARAYCVQMVREGLVPRVRSEALFDTGRMSGVWRHYDFADGARVRITVYEGGAVPPTLENAVAEHGGFEAGRPFLLDGRRARVASGRVAFEPADAELAPGAGPAAVVVESDVPDDLTPVGIAQGIVVLP